MRNLRLASILSLKQILLMAFLFYLILPLTGLIRSVDASDLVPVLNAGFEDQTKGVANFWSPGPTAETVIIEKHTGERSLKLHSVDGSWRSVSQKIGKLLPDRDYKITFWFKTSANNKYIAALNLYDATNQMNKHTQLAGDGSWREVSRTFHTGPDTADHEYYIYLYGHLTYAEAPGVAGMEPIYYDDITLELLPIKADYLTVTSGQEARTIGFGKADACTGDIKCNLNALSQPLSETVSGNVTGYRNLLAGQSVVIKFPAFNIDAQDTKGLPLTPMLLDIRYKDVGRDCASISSRIDFRQKDPLVDYGYNTQYQNIVSLGKWGNNGWRNLQYGFAKTQFQLIRAIEGSFQIKISAAKSSDVPISSVTLRAITEDESKKLQAMLIDMNGFERVALPVDAPSTKVEYPDPDFVTFVRDPMRPVNKNTRPGLEEANVSDINVSSAPGEIEPVSVSIYSEAGIEGLTFSASDLISEEGGVVPAKDIVFKKAVYNERRLSPYMNEPESKAFNLLQDYLDGFETISVAAGESESVWVKIRVPENATAGEYKGVLYIKSGEDEVKRFNLVLDVLPMKLELPANINILYSSPYNLKTMDVGPAVELYKETDLEPWIHESNNDIITKEDNGGTFSFDTTRLENKVQRMVSEGMIKKHAMIYLWDVIADIQTQIYNDRCTGNKGVVCQPGDIACTACVDKYRASTKDLYTNLSENRFENAFKKAVKQLIELGKKYKFEFIYNVTDEPGKDQRRRIVSDRLYTFIKDIGGLTSVTYFVDCDSPVDITLYNGVPNNQIPPLTDLIDYKVWTPAYQDADHALAEKETYGYYTTNTGYLTYPIYNRFVHGLLAYVTGARVINAYGLDVTWGDPYNDFDQASSIISVDFRFAYPTWSDKALPRLAFEGLREGIKDAKYLATLEKLISENSELEAAKNAADYLALLKKTIDPKFSKNYINKLHNDVLYRGDQPLGLYPYILKNVSQERDPDDFEAFTKVRNNLIGHIKNILSEGAIKPPPLPEDFAKAPPIVAQTPTEESVEQVVEVPDTTDVEQRAEQGVGGCSLIKRR